MPEKTDAVRAIGEAFGADAVDAALALLHPDVELLPIRARLEGNAFRGHQGYRELLSLFEQDWEELRLSQDRIEQVGERVLATGRITAMGRTSGVPLDMPLAVLYDFRDGLIVRMESFADLDEARSAARDNR